MRPSGWRRQPPARLPSPLQTLHDAGYTNTVHCGGPQTAQTVKLHASALTGPHAPPCLPAPPNSLSPPHSSMLTPGTSTTRTSSSYFSPNMAVAPAARAWSKPVSYTSSGEAAATQLLTRRSTSATSAGVTGRLRLKSNLEKHKRQAQSSGQMWACARLYVVTDPHKCSISSLGWPVSCLFEHTSKQPAESRSKRQPMPLLFLHTPLFCAPFSSTTGL